MSEPAITPVLNMIGRVRETGDLGEAERLARLLALAASNDHEAWDALGSVLLDRGQPGAAAACFSRSISGPATRSTPPPPAPPSDQADPAAAEARNRAGVALIREGKADLAIEAFRRALRADPGATDAWNNLGAAFRRKLRYEESLAAYAEALARRPDFPEALNNRGNVLRSLSRPQEAEADYREALRLNPAYPEAWNNLGNVLKDQSRIPEALVCYERALSVNPGLIDALIDLGLTRLLLGDLERGWEGYERRWEYPDFPKRTFPRPAWDGSPLAGRTILVHAEQGLGDTLQFIRYAPLVKARGARVIVECQAPLLPLVKTCAGIDEVVAQGSPLPAFDVHAPLLSLPRLFGTTLATIPASLSYLSADPATVDRLRPIVDAVGGFKVGIAWQGNPQHARDRERSIPLRLFEPLARADGVRLVSLQKGFGIEQARDVTFPLVDLGSRLDLLTGSFQEAAAVVTCLDLVVTADTSLAHLAGALGKSVWLLLPTVPDWRWLLDRLDTPWYPSMRLFRQTHRADWAGVMTRVAAALQERK